MTMHNNLKKSRTNVNDDLKYFRNMQTSKLFDTNIDKLFRHDYAQ